MHPDYEQMGEGLAAMWRQFAFLLDLASSSFPPRNGDSRRAEFEGWQSVLEAWAGRVAATTGAGEVRLCLKLAADEYFVVSPECIAAAHGPPVTKGVFKPTRLAVPILASNQWIGYIQIDKPHSGEFTTQDKRLLQATTALLGMAADRALLLHLQQSFADHLVHDQKIQFMLHRVWALTNNGTGDSAQTLDLVISAVRRAVPCRALITRLWDLNGKKLYEFEEAADPEMLAFVQDAIEEASGPTIASKTVWARRYPAQLEALGDGERSGESAAFLGAVVIVPLQRLHSTRGVMALARGGESLEFSTEEKQALCIVSGLINGLNGD